MSTEQQTLDLSIVFGIFVPTTYRGYVTLFLRITMQCFLSIEDYLELLHFKHFLRCRNNYHIMQQHNSYGICLFSSWFFVCWLNVEVKQKMHCYYR